MWKPQKSLQSTSKVWLWLSVHKDIFSVVCYRYDVSCFDVEAGQVVVVAVILQSPNLKGC